MRRSQQMKRELEDARSLYDQIKELSNLDEKILAAKANYAWAYVKEEHEKLAEYEARKTRGEERVTYFLGFIHF